MRKRSHFLILILFIIGINKNYAQITTSKSDVSCCKCTDGSASVSVSGGTPPYTYQWSNGKTGSSINGLSPGAYSVNVKDANGCTGSGSVNVGKPSCPPDDFDIPVFAGGDPNDITGPLGYGPAKWVSVKDVLPYRIRFENDPKIATAAANKIIVTHPIDPAANMFTFRLGPISFRNFVVDVPPNTSHFFKRLDLVDSIGVFVDITAGLDVTKKQAFWIFQAFDSATGLPNINPELGVLLINDSITHGGEGAVNFSIKPKSTSATGDSIKAYADIIFDVNATIRTNVDFNTIDAYPPASKITSVTPLDAENVRLAWKAQDDAGGSGIAKYKLLVATNDAPYITYAEGITDTFIVFHVSNGYTYKLQTIAIDNVNNAEPIKSEPDTTIEIKADSFFITPNYMSKTCVGNPFKISWRNINDILNMSIQLSDDSGKTYTAIRQNISVSDSVFVWNIPSTLAGNKQYKMRAVSLATNQTFATSDFFLIKNNINVYAGTDRELCAGDSTLIGGSPTAANGIEPYRYKWLPSQGLSFDSISNPYLHEEGNYIVKVTDSIGCSNSDTVEITTHTLPDIYAYGLDSAYYINSEKDSLFGFPQGGIFSGAGITGTLFDPALAGVGTHTITYTYANEYGCSAAVINYTKVFPEDSVVIVGLDSVYCINNSPVTLTGMPAGGTFSGPGVFGNIFNPSIAGEGTHEIKYTYSDLTGTLVEVVDTTRVYPLPLVSFSGLASSYYLNDSPVSLTGTPSGGTFTGPGISDTIFNPMVAGAGTHTIIYTYADNKGCSNKASATTTVNPITAVTIDGFLTYDNTANSPLGKTAVYLRNINAATIDTTLTDSTGYFSIEQVEPGDFILSAETDIDWGGVNATDALIVKKYAIGIVPLSELRKLAADVNLSNTINATDALTISKRTVGLISSFPAGDWVFEKDSITVEDININHDFQGVCTGDVNGSYLPPANKNQTISLIHEGKISPTSLQDFDIPIKTTANLNLGAITLGLTYPPDLITVKNVSSKAKGLIYNLDNGTVKIAWADPVSMAFNKNDLIVTLKCSVNNTAVGILNIGLLSGGEFADANANVIEGVVLSSPAIELSSVTDNNNVLGIPKHFSLSQNYPNPFSKITEIEYELPEAGEVTLTVYNVLGISISEIVNTRQPAGKYNLKYDASHLASGVYIYEIKIIGSSNNFTQSRIMSVSK